MSPPPPPVAAIGLVHAKDSLQKDTIEPFRLGFILVVTKSILVIVFWATLDLTPPPLK